MQEVYYKDAFSIKESPKDGFDLYFDDVFITNSKDYFALKCDIFGRYAWLTKNEITDGLEDEAFFVNAHSEISPCTIIATFPGNGSLFIEHGGFKRLAKKSEIYPATRETRHIVRKLNYLSGKSLEIRNKMLDEICELKSFADLHNPLVEGNQPKPSAG